MAHSWKARVVIQSLLQPDRVVCRQSIRYLTVWPGGESSQHLSGLSVTHNLITLGHLGLALTGGAGGSIRNCTLGSGERFHASGCHISHYVDLLEGL